MSCTPRIRHLRRTRIIRKLRRDDLARIPGQIGTDRAKIKLTLRHLRVKRIDLVDNAVVEIDPDIMNRCNRRVDVDIILRNDEHRGLRRGEDGDWQVGGLRHVVHAQVEV